MSRDTPRDLIGIGASAGGVLLLRALLARLPADLPAAVFVTLHRSPLGPSILAEVLGHNAALPVLEPADGDAHQPGHVYVAPRDLHMTVHDGQIRLDRGPRQHHTRPAIDPLFSSLAGHGARVAGVLLSGNLSDGVAGLVAIKGAGGLSLVQDPFEAEFPSMPQKALFYDHVDLVFHIDAAPALLTRLARGQSPQSAMRGLDVWQDGARLARDRPPHP